MSDEPELPGETAPIRREGDWLAMKARTQNKLLSYLANLERIDEDFPDFDQGLLPAREITL